LPTFNNERKAKFQLEVSVNNVVFCQSSRTPENYPWTPKGSVYSRLKRLF